MNNATPRLGTEPYLLPELKVTLHTPGMSGGVCFDTLTARNAPVDLIYTRTNAAYEDGEEVMAAGVKVQAIRTSGPVWLDSDTGAVLSFTVGTCLQHMMNDHEIEAVEEALLKILEDR